LRFLSLLIENKEAIRHETGKILMRKFGISKAKSIMIDFNSLLAFIRPLRMWPKDKTINKIKTAPIKKMSHSLRISFLIFDISSYKKDQNTKCGLGQEVFK